MSQINDFDLRKLGPDIIKQAVIWFPVVIGVFHQFLMVIDYSDRIYVFVDPPGYIEPFVTLEVEWWFVLLFISSLLAISAYARRFQGIPNRIAFPFYSYVLFLLIFVKPI